MDWKLELVAIPVSDVDRAKAFYVEQVGFVADHDHVVNEALRFVQLTPPGSACSIVVGTGLTDGPRLAKQPAASRRRRRGRPRTSCVGRGLDVGEVQSSMGLVRLLRRSGR